MDETLIIHAIHYGNGGAMRASDLAKAYNNMTLEPLKEEEEFKEFYVYRPENAPSPIEGLNDRIRIAEGAEKYLFLGFRGSGKSTELYRLVDMIDQERFLVVHYSIRDELNLSDFDFRDFFVSMALKVLERADDVGLSIFQDIKEDLHRFMKGITMVSEEEITTSKGAGLSLEKFLSLKISQEKKTREVVRKELEMRIGDLLVKLNGLIHEVEDLSGKRLIIVVDDLDKLTRGSQAEDFFYNNYELLLQPNCLAIYTFPIPLTFHPSYEMVRQAFDDDVLLPQLPVKGQDGAIKDDNLNFYMDVIYRRMDRGLVDEEALKKAILSTGKLSEFMRVMREACIRAYRRRAALIGDQDVEGSLEKFRRTYDRTISQAHKERLIEIHESKEARDKDNEDDISRDLLFSLTAVEYEDESGRWCDVDPLLLPLVERWRSSQQKT